MTAMGMTAVVVVWGMADTPSLAMFANDTVSVLLKSRGWFVMLTVSFLLFSCFGLALSRYGGIRLGRDDDRPEFATFTWLNMMFAAGMGVGLLFYGVAEPTLHYEFISKFNKSNVAMGQALSLTRFHWGLHAWAIYGVGGLVIAYFGFRLGRPKTISAPIYTVFGRGPVARVTGWWVDVMALYAIAIGLSGSIAMGGIPGTERTHAIMTILLHRQTSTPPPLPCWKPFPCISSLLWPQLLRRFFSSSPAW